MDEILIILTVLVGIAIADFVIIGIYIRAMMNLIKRLIPRLY